MSTSLNKKQIIELLPHREPMLLIDELYDIKKLFSASAVVNVKKDSFFVDGHFPGQPVMPGVLIVESFGQAAAALTAHGLDKSTYENKLVFLMGVEKARFRNPVIPDCKLILKIEASIFKINLQSGITGFLNLAFSTPIRNTSLFSYVDLSKPCAVKAAAAWPKDSTINTPGITGCPGKWPSTKKLSFLTFTTADAENNFLIS